MHRQRPRANVRAPRFTVGRDVRGNWVVTDAKGLAGGIFNDRSAAIHFALAESQSPADVCVAPAGQVLSLDAVFRH
ncbi:hypothetical protein PRN20_13710 [Devosia sp. ZB163]|uniref:hypothetical protein n=1 Tax=Devosia sp. ZB163 TaxID=3025938 RepID=UPI002362F628|nr:hypothetical protein [Devosia sp. ZB163]MDC9824787.1 hypothetical protein [Devosia sp. ZB163]